MHSFTTRIVRGAATALVFIAFTGSSARAQTHPAAASSFAVGYTDIGPTVGLGGINGASASFGGRFEHALRALPQFGNGTLGIGVSADYYSYSNAFFNVKYIPLGATANYHFKLDNAKIDPFLGLGLGYQIINCSYAGNNSIGCANSELYFIGHVGGRYFFAPAMAAYADLGAGAATLNVGVTFKLH